LDTIVINELILRQVLELLKQHSRCLQRDAYAKKLYVWNTTILFLVGILKKYKSVEAIASHLSSSPWLQEMVDLTSIHGSSLNRRLDALPTEVLRQTYEELVVLCSELYGVPCPMKHLGPLTIIDSSSLTLGAVRGEWAYLQKGKNAVKLHVGFDLTGEHSGIPSRAVLSTACVADLDAEVTEALMKNKDTTYVLDRGYLDYGQFLKWDREGIFFVTRLKANSKVRVISKQPVVGSSIVQDAEVELTVPHTGETGRLRLVTYTFVDKKGKKHTVRALTNRMDLSSEDISEIYRYRWKVELFFKFMKQQLQLKKIYSAKEKAVWNQIYLNLIAYLLVEIWRQKYVPKVERRQVMTELRGQLGRSMRAILAKLGRSKERTSRGRRKKGGRPRIHPKRLKRRRILYK